MKKKTVTISIIQLLDKFSNEDIAVKWLEKMRWGDKPVCPHCGGTEHITRSKTQKYQYWHKDCRKRFTAKTNTIMHASPIEVRKWLVAMYYVMTDRKGISSLELSKQLGITQKSSWYMLQRIREACGGNGFQLSNIVEVDETYLGGKEQNKHKSKQLKVGGGTTGKQPVIGMRERGGKVKAMSIKDAKGNTLREVVRENVEKGSTVYTDDFRGYRGLVGSGRWPYDYNHKAVNHSAKEYVNGMIHTNGIESVWALLKRGYTGTFHHFSMKHLQRYLDEFTFRLNEGNVDVDTIDRIAAICKRVHGKRISYQDLIA
ncbi:MAG: IS1595 family transposase [Gammaproteobacteria bacterium]|nr:IS1595 family transposase [Gammaproteobacteria bacterium]